MCTSIAVYKAKPIYAMNFDFFEVESRIRISNSGSVPAFFYEIKQGEEFLETAGMNVKGFFGNFQGNLSDKHENVMPDSNCITIDKLYRKFLNSGKSVEEMKNVLNEKTVAYPPVPPVYNKLHNMFADKYGNAIILETANKRNDVTKIKNNFLIMTNFPVGQFKNVDYKAVSGVGSDRYKMAYEYISNINTSFGIENAFEVLKSTVQKEKEFETLISMVFDPNELSVYIAIRRNFEKLWKVDINKKCIETFSGSREKESKYIGNSSVCIAELEKQ